MDTPSKQEKFIPHHVTPATAGKREPAQIQRSFKETLICWLPTDSNTLLFELVAVIYLVIGLIQFSHTGETSMLTTLLTYVGAYVGLAEVKPIFSRGKREDSDLCNKRPDSS